MKLHYDGTASGCYFSGWVGGSDLASAEVFRIPSSGSKRINVTMTEAA